MNAPDTIRDNSAMAASMRALAVHLAEIALGRCHNPPAEAVAAIESAFKPGEERLVRHATAHACCIRAESGTPERNALLLAYLASSEEIKNWHLDVCTTIVGAL